MQMWERTKVQVNGLVFCTVESGTGYHLLMKRVRIERGLGASC
jgi:hypothetical protein